jgi:hypothetical protein
MRKFFMGLGVLTTMLVVAGGIGFYFLASKGQALDRMSKAYVDDTVVAIAANWDANELLKRAGPRLRATARPDEIRGLFDVARGALGPMLDYGGSRGEAILSVANSQPMVSAKYVAKGHFQKGDAELQIVLSKQGDTWLIEGFHISSSALMKRLVGVRS